MENASKALYMAGGILISIFVAAIMVYLFQKGAILSYEFDTRISDGELQAYNSEFLKYTNKEKILAQDIVSVINKAYSINKLNNEEGGKDYIKIKIVANETYSFDERTHSGDVETGKSCDEFLIKYSNTKPTFSAVENRNLIIYENTFEIKNILYYPNGKIKYLEFVKQW